MFSRNIGKISYLLTFATIEKLIHPSLVLKLIAVVAAV